MSGMPYVSFISDFGITDETVAVCKGVILSKNPDLHVIDISHMVPPFDVISGGWLLAGCFPYIPTGVHLAVVDPGVGSDRAILIAEAFRGDLFVAPDNGILPPSLKKLGGLKSLYRVNDELISGHEVSPTFHGRDVMAPIVASLATGSRPEEYGIKIRKSLIKPYPVPDASLNGSLIKGHVTFIDRYGTIRSNIPWYMVAGSECHVLIDGSFRQSIIKGMTFSDVSPGMPIVLKDSWGYLSIAVNKGRAVDMIQLNSGDPLSVKFTM